MLINHINGQTVQFGGRTGSTRTTLQASGSAQLYVDGLCATATNVLNGISITSSDLFVTNTLQTLNLISTLGTISDLLVTGSTRLSATSVSNLNVTGSSIGTLDVSNIRSTSASIGTLDVTSSRHTGCSIGTLDVTSIRSTGSSIGTLDVTSIRSTGSSIGTLDVTSARATSMTATSLVASASTISSLNVSSIPGSVTIGTATITSLVATGATSGYLIIGSKVPTLVQTGTLAMPCVSKKSISISYDGTIAVVGNDTNEKAYVFERINGTWTTTGSLSATTGTTAFGVGASISGSGSVICIGAGADGTPGAMWTYVRGTTGTTWTPLGSKIVPSDNTGQAGFGDALSLDYTGSRIVIGGFNDNGGVGAAWLFGSTGGSFSQLGSKFTGSVVVGGFYGSFVRMSPYGDSFVTLEVGTNGQMYIYDINPLTDAVTETARIIGTVGFPSLPSGSQLGTFDSLAYNRHFIAVGARASGSGAGSLYTFRRNPNGFWNTVGSLITVGGSTAFGYSCALSAGVNPVLAVGSANSLYTYTLDTIGSFSLATTTVTGHAVDGLAISGSGSCIWYQNKTDDTHRVYDIPDSSISTGTVKTGTVNSKGPLISDAVNTDMLESMYTYSRDTKIDRLRVTGSSVLQDITAGTLKTTVITTGALNVSGSTVLQVTSVTSLSATSFSPASLSTGTLSVSGSSSLQSTTVATLRVTGFTSLQATTIGELNVGRIHIQMNFNNMSSTYGSTNRHAIINTTSGSQAYSSGSFTITPTTGRVSVPVSGLYVVSYWMSVNQAGWYYITINGTQTVDDLTTYYSAISSGARTMASAYSANGTVTGTWSGYLSTSDYFYFGNREATTVLTSTNPNGFSCTLISRAS